jgi:hypothetical protein
MRGGRAELFFARSMIVVEGQSELIVLPAFAEYIGCDLDRDGISLVEAGNNNFAFILNSCSPSNFSIPSVVIYDSDDLRYGNGLLKEAYKAQLINITKRDEAEQLTSNDRIVKMKSILDEIGWFGAIECLEEEMCKNGYMDVVLGVIHNNDPEHNSDQKAFESFLNGQAVTPNLVTQFIKKRDTLKIPVAQGIYRAVETIGHIPTVYENAIRKAVLLSQQGLIVDNYFEARAWSAGFKNILLEFIEEKGLSDQYKQFLVEDAKGLPAPIQFNEFAKCKILAKEFRVDLKNRISDAILVCGCSEFAKNVRDGSFIDGG